MFGRSTSSSVHRASAILLVLAAATLAACGGAAAATSGPTPGETTPRPILSGGNASSGETLYAELGCKGCHGVRGEKDTVGPNLFSITWDDHEREEARETILAGEPDHRPPMPSYRGKVDDAKIADLLAFFEQK